MVLGVEALDYNPLIKLYRQLTPDMRTEWEKAHILSLKDLRFAQKFSISARSGTGILSVSPVGSFRSFCRFWIA